MTIRFYANGGVGVGYKANVMFFNNSSPAMRLSRIYTDCGGYVETLGGAITMMHMINNETEPRQYDCIWLIRPSSNYMHLKTHLSLRVDAFRNFGKTFIDFITSIL